MDARDKAATAREPDWVGPRAFDDRFGHAGIDHDFGMRWGERREQRISLRRASGAQCGVLYAYDPPGTSTPSSPTTCPSRLLRRPFAPLDIDTHMHVLSFAELVRCHQILGTSTPDRPAVNVAVIHP